MTESGAKLILTTATVCCAWVLLFIPRPILPNETPSLTLDRSLAAASMQRDIDMAANVPSGPEVDDLQALLRAQGIAELSAAESSQDFQLRRIRSGRAARKVLKEHGAVALDALRAAAALQFEQALAAGEVDDRLFGSFPEVLATYGAVIDGVRIAPAVCLRALYKARWNAIMKRSLTEGLSDIENRAYWGWLALHSNSQAPATRAAALEQYAAHGGQGVQEAAGVLAYLAGAWKEASALLRREYERTDRLRLRNFSLGALQMAQR